MVKSRKGELQIDYVVAMGIFIVTFAFLLYFVTNYIQNNTFAGGDIRNKGIQAQSILFGSEGLPTNWEKTNNTVRVGLVKKLYRVPIYVYANTSRENWPVEALVDFDQIPYKNAIVVTDVNNTKINSQVQNLTEPIDEAYVYFVTNLTQGRNVFYVYYSNQNVTETNYSFISSASTFASDCEKKVNTTKLVFNLCKGSNDNNGPGIRSLVDPSQNFEIADNKSIDQPLVGGDYNLHNIQHNFTKFEEGPIYARYRLAAHNGNTTVVTYYSFYNGSRVWKVESNMTTTNVQNKTIFRNHMKDVFDQFQNHNTSAITIPNTQMFNMTDYGVAINSSSGYVFATAIKSNTTFEVGWNKTIEPEIRTLSNPTGSEIKFWHYYGPGDINTSRDLFNEINITVLSREIIDSIGFEKLDGLSITQYDSAKSSLDMGQDNFFVRISNSSGQIFSYGQDQKKRDVYVESGKTLMQTSYGTIEFVTYTIGVWR